MLRNFFSRGPLAWVVVSAVLCIIAGAVIPPLVENRTRQLSTTENITVTSTDPNATVMRPDASAGASAGADTGTAAGADSENPDPACRVAEGQEQPLRCRIHTGQVSLERTTVTGKAPGDDAVATVDTELNFLVGDTPAGKISISTLLNRESAYPAAGSPTNLQVTIDGASSTLGADTTQQGVERQGIGWFFPAQTEQRSYPFFDPLARTDIPLDFAGTQRLEGIPTYTFHHREAAVPLSRLLSDGNSDPTPDFAQVSGPARLFYSPQEISANGFSPEETMVLDAYYSVERTVWVEPTTGRVVNATEDINVSFARDAEEATAQADAEEASKDRTLVDATLTWTDASRQAELEKVTNVVEGIKVLSIIAWAGKAAAVVLLAVAAWLFMRRPDTRYLPGKAPEHSGSTSSGAPSSGAPRP